MTIDPTALRHDIEAYRARDEAAGNRLCTILHDPVRRDTARLLGDDDADVDDVTQEALVAALGYLRRDRSFDGDLVRLTVSIARNRCRDILRTRSRRPQTDIESLERWLACPGRSALDDLHDAELHGLLQSALDQLPPACRRLLHALYVEDRTPEEVRRQVGLNTVQGIYYRRSMCLEQARKFVQRRLRFGSWTSMSPLEAEARHPGGSAR